MRDARLIPATGDERAIGALEALLPGRRGHFALESGHHGALWLDLELLFLRPDGVQVFALELAGRLSSHAVDAVCGPLVEGAFVALTVASALGLPFAYAERGPRGDGGGLFPFGYRVPGRLREVLAGKRVAIVNDVVNAGSAVRGAHADLVALGAKPVVVGTLVTLGDGVARFAAYAGLALETLAAVPNEVWAPAACPLCAAGVPLERRE